MIKFIQVTVLALASLDLANGHYGPKEIRVKAHHSIQKAIDGAPPGSRIVVEAGTYSEQLTISKDGIQLIGSPGTVLIPPAQPPTKPNTCTGLAGDGTVAGICITGDVDLEAFKTEHRKVQKVKTHVECVKVEGFEVRGFKGLNIAIVGARNAEVSGNTVYDGTQYGILTVGSESSDVRGNRVSSADLKFIGICMDDTSDVRVTYNHITDYGIALCVQTNKAQVSNNIVGNCCYGAFVDPGVKGAQVTHNEIGPSNKLCNPYFGGFATGIQLEGSIDAVVKYNHVTGSSDNGNKNNIAAGVAIADDPTSAATGNVVEFNYLKGNEQDVLVIAKGKNTVKYNVCSTPGNICKHQK